jgi:hypothetical protein
MNTLSNDSAEVKTEAPVQTQTPATATHVEQPKQERGRMPKTKKKVKGYRAKPVKILSMEEVQALVNSPEYRKQAAERGKEFDIIRAKSYQERFRLLLDAITTMSSLIVSFEDNGPDECEALMDELSDWSDHIDDIYEDLITIKKSIIEPLFERVIIKAASCVRQGSARLEEGRTGLIRE